MVFKIGTGFLTLLALVFITLKLLKYIDWSWWWVLSPIWIPIALSLLVWGTILILGWLLLI